MDSDSLGERLKKIKISESDCEENANESTEEEVPKILRPELRDVFRIFVSMLDIKSFMKLAMASKEMYNVRIEINVDVNKIDVSNRDGSVEFKFFLGLHPRFRDSYVTKRKLPCRLSLRTLSIGNPFQEKEALVEYEFHRSMKEIGVKKIHELVLRSDIVDSNAVFAIIKDFDVKSVNIQCLVKYDVLRSFLKLNLDNLTCLSLGSADFILEIESPIPNISISNGNHMPNEVFMNIVEKIQAGSLNHVTVHHSQAVDWRDYDKLPYTYKRRLPNERPLLFARTARKDIHEYWFLHWHGGVTKCVRDRRSLAIFKCDSCDLPYILRKEEDILKDLTEKRPRLSCSAKHFRTFCQGITMIDPSQDGPVPENRPIYYKHSAYNFWMLDVDDTLMNCTWDNNIATWKSVNRREMQRFKHPALAKYAFWIFLKQLQKYHRYDLYCEAPEVFDSWFDDFEMLDFEYSDALPNSRPLIFGTSDGEYHRFRVVLLEDRLIKCIFSLRYDGVPHVEINRCELRWTPPILLTAENIAEILKDPYCQDCLRIRYEIFSDTLKLLKKPISVLQKGLLIYETTATEFWYWINGVIRKVEWKEGCLLLSKVSLCDAIPEFMKQVFRYIAENEEFRDSHSRYIRYPFAEDTLQNHYRCSYKLNREQFNDCLEQFTVVPFDYSGPLTSDRPMAFVKNLGSSHEEPILVWFLWNGVHATNCVWGTNDSMYVCFGTKADDIPLALQSKEFLESILQANYCESSRLFWFGGFEQLRVCLKDYLKLPFDYDGPLPEGRSLLFENNEYSNFLLRQDGTILNCYFYGSRTSLFLRSPSYVNLPPVLKNMR